MTLSLRITTLLITFALIGAALGPAAAGQAAPPAQTPAGQPQPEVRVASRVGSSAPLHDQPPASAPILAPQREKAPFLGQRPSAGIASNTPHGDAALQAYAPSAATATIEQNFNGLGNTYGYVPPDTVGEVGPNHYVQMVNVQFAVYSKTGVRLGGPWDFNDLFQGFGGPCETSNDGDPIVVYDQMADRWLLSQFALPNATNWSLLGPFYECVAVSKTGDPTGAYHLYEFKISDTKMNDYPKIGVWPDGYYMSINQFTDSGSAGQGVVAFERSKMLQGLPAKMIYIDLAATAPGLFAMLTADLDGARLPPAGAPMPFIMHVEGYPNDKLSIWNFHVDWATPANATFTHAVDLTVSPFDSNMCNYARNCIPQPGGRPLDALTGAMMFRLQYRNFGDHEALVANHTVDATSSDRAGVRWYELRKTTGSWSVYQQGTFAPADGHHRWMASAALNGGGDLAIGYSISSTTMYPSLRAAGRFAEDPLGQLTQGDSALVLAAGAGSQDSTYYRWGDYAAMTVDPLDDCTFWFTSEYYSSNSTSAWRTRISAFKLRACTSGVKASLRGAVTRSGEPGMLLAGATVEALQGGAVVASTTTTAAGDYWLLVDAGEYDLRVSLSGYLPATASGLNAVAGETLTQDFALDVASMYTLSGVVTDAETGWPLYARLDFEGHPANPVWTNPLTGAYSLQLQGGVEIPLSVEAFLPGYQKATQTLTALAGPTTLNIALAADAAACTAPGRVMQPGGCAAQPGGLAAGVATDLNTGDALPNAFIRAENEAETLTRATPLDPAVPDGFYWLYLPAGSHTLQAGRSGYVTQSAVVTVVNSQIVAQDFALPAPRLEYSPAEIHATIESGLTSTETITLENTGSAAAAFTLAQIALPAAAGPFEQPNYALKPFKLHAATAEGVKLPDLPTAPALLEGPFLPQTLQASPPAYGLAFDPASGSLWISSPSAAWGGADRLVEYSPAGEPSGRTFAYTLPHTFGPADAAYNPHTRTFWLMGAGAPTCIYEVHPLAGETGRSICPNVPEDVLRGLAYDPATATFLAGGWGDGMIYRFGYDGKLLSRVNTGLPIAGLAYQPATQRLFAITSAAGSPVFVLDAARRFALLGRFSITGFSDFGGAGLDLDSQGRLWALDQKTGLVYHTLAAADTLPAAPAAAWLRIRPASGTLAPGQSRAISLAVNAAGVLPGQYSTGILVGYTSPYSITPLPFYLTVEKLVHFPFRALLPFIGAAPK